MSNSLSETRKKAANRSRMKVFTADGVPLIIEGGRIVRRGKGPDRETKVKNLMAKWSEKK
jgi:hypothetical protein